MQLLENVKALEHKSNRNRGDQILQSLKKLGLNPIIQKFPWPETKNIVVDFRPRNKGNHILLSAHYDAVRDSPGANDNASGVAVLLGLCSQLRLPSPVKVIFFDREEAWLRTPVLRLGLLGSFYYVLRNSLNDIKAVVNLEYCGSGEMLVMWPIGSEHANLPIVKYIEKIAADRHLPLRSASVPWFFHSSDHLPFRLAGLANSATLSLLPAGCVTALENILSKLNISLALSGKRLSLPEPLSLIHTDEDTSGKLSENSLQLMLSLIMELVELVSNPPR